MPELLPWRPVNLNRDQLEGYHLIAPRAKWRPFYVSPRWRYPSDYREVPEKEIEIEVRISATKTKIVTTPFFSAMLLRNRFLTAEAVTPILRQSRQRLRQLAYWFYRIHIQAMNRQAYFMTINPRECSDVVSLLWEAVWQGKIVDKRILGLYIGSIKRDWEYMYKKYEIEFEELTERKKRKPVKLPERVKYLAQLRSQPDIVEFKYPHYHYRCNLQATGCERCYWASGGKDNPFSFPSYIPFREILDSDYRRTPPERPRILGREAFDHWERGQWVLSPRAVSKDKLTSPFGAYHFRVVG